MRDGPSLDSIRALRRSLGDLVSMTPLLRCPALAREIGSGTEVCGKLEFLQRTGTFKARGALAALHALTPSQRQAGVTAVSAGNHAIATAFAASVLEVDAKVVMTASANPARVAACRAYGADVVIAEDVHAAFALAADIQRLEGRAMIHPFEGEAVATGAGTLGLEMHEQAGPLDAVVVPVGGGGLLGGVANALRRLRPHIRIIGVEPVGADSMTRSLAVGRPQRLDRVDTIADSLGAPFAMPYSFGLVRRNVDRIVRVDDESLRLAMGFLFTEMKLAVEPACAASTAALLGPLRAELRGCRILLLFCGSNIDWETYRRYVRFRREHAD